MSAGRVLRQCFLKKHVLDGGIFSRLILERHALKRRFFKKCKF